MKRWVAPLAAVVGGLALMAAGPAWAGSEAHSMKLSLDTAVVVAGKTLPAGDYTFTWMGSGPQVDVNVMEHGRTIDTAKAKIVAESHRAEDQSFVTRKGHSGTPVLEELHPRGEKSAVVFKTA